jgi:large subunit ribosomal protein L23
MALFSKKQKDTAFPKEKVKTATSAKEVAVSEKSEDKVAKKAKKAVKGSAIHLTKAPSRILKSPRITEKAVYMTMNHTYVFDVAQDATKRDIMTAIKALYDVTPRKVNIVNKEPRAYVARFRNRIGTKSGMKKAYVFLKKGDKIDFA